MDYLSFDTYGTLPKMVTCYLFIYYIYEKGDIRMIHTIKLLPYRILRLYISYKYDNSTVINRLTLTCPKYITNLDIANYITEDVLKTRSISKTIDLFPDNDIYPIETDISYSSYDISLYLSRNVTSMNRYCEYLNGDKYSTLNDVIEK